MILLTCVKIPENSSLPLLADEVSSLFSHPENQGYMDEILKRANQLSVIESLFALKTLHGLICRLPAAFDPSVLRLSRNENGKPYFVGAHLRFSISHSRGYVACALSDCEEVGIDLEASQIEEGKALAISSRFFASREREAVQSDPKIFSRLWTEKEAKAKFWGISVGNLFSIEKSIPNPPEFQAVTLHRFKKHNIPITLCTKRSFSTIFFL